MLRHWRHRPAVVAFHPTAGFVVCKCDRAIAALKFFAAGPAQDYRRIPAPVQQHHSLFFALQPQPNLPDQLPRDHLFSAGFLKLLPHIDEFDFRQRTLLNPVRHFDQCIAILLGIEIRFQRRRGRAQHDHRVRKFCAHHCDIARMITRRLFLFIRRILLFVDDDQCEI